jgi:amino acid transporter
MNDTDATGSLSRSLGPVAVALLTLSCLSPAASVFIAGADIVHQAGTGAALAFVLGGLLTLVFTFAQAELGSSFPVAGGDYAMVGNVLGPRWGFIQFAVTMLGAPVFLALSATGIALYLRVVMPGLPAVPTALVALAVSTGCAMLNVRTGALITCLFLTIELAALALVTVLGFAKPVRGLGAALVTPVQFIDGLAHPLGFGVLAVAIAAGSWATSGAGQSIYFSEELHNPAQIGRLIIVITLIAFTTMLLPVLGLVVGSPDLEHVLAAESPFAAFIALRTSSGLAAVTSLAIAAAIFNANLAGIICYGRFTWSSGRDAIWSAPINAALVRLHPRYNSPWVATLVVGIVSMIFSLLGLRALLIIAAATGIVTWTMLNAAGLIGRRRGLTGNPGTYRAPLYPLTHILSFAGAAGLAVLAWRDAETGRLGELLVIAVMIAAALYHQLILARRPGGWVMPKPIAA